MSTSEPVGPATINLGYGQDKPYHPFKNMVRVATLMRLAKELQGLTIDELALHIVVSGQVWILYLTFCGLQFKFEGSPKLFSTWKDRGFYGRNFLPMVVDEIADAYEKQILDLDWSVANLPQGA